MARDTDITRREGQGSSRPQTLSSPFRVLDRFADEMDRLFDDFGLGRGWGLSRMGRSSLSPSVREDWAWSPDVEMLYRNNELIVRADLPGLTKNDVKVDVAEDRLTIQGERRHEREEEREGMHRSERSYGAFRRDILLPAGTMSDQAKATFENGVLEITMPAAPESARRGRRLEISDTAAKK